MLAKNTKTLVPLASGFAQAFGDFARITQNGNWVNGYICRLSAQIYGAPNVSGSDAVTAIEKLLAGGLPASVTKLLNGLPLSTLNTNVPLKLPGGPVGNFAQHTKVCQ